MESIDSIETYAHGPNKDLIKEKETFKCNNIIKQKIYSDIQTMINFDDYTNEKNRT